MTKVKQRGIGVRESLFNTVLLYVEVPRNQKNKLIKSCNNAILPHNHKHKSGIIIDLYLKIYSNFFAFKNFIWVIIYFACKSVWFAALPDRHYTVIFFLTVYLYISNELVQRAATSLLWKSDWTAFFSICPVIRLWIHNMSSMVLSFGARWFILFPRLPDSGGLPVLVFSALEAHHDWFLLVAK